jgi:hypothetical protein
LDNGDYPDSLDPIASSSNEPHMLDPFSGKPFGYRRVDPASDPHQRGFLLWTVGYDGVDNGGTVPDRNWDAALRPAGEGTDMILNDPRW